MTVSSFKEHVIMVVVWDHRDTYVPQVWAGHRCHFLTFSLHVRTDITSLDRSVPMALRGKTLLHLYVY